MRFHVGQDVYIKWDSPAVAPKDREFLCSFGVITDGPYPPFYRAAGEQCTCQHQTWGVATSAGEAFVAEYLLQPFDEPGDERVVEMEKLLSFTE